MRKWLAEQIAAKEKKALPVLSFPCIQLMGLSVKDLISSSENQAKGMKLIADRCDSAASVSLMDLSLEAECFGSRIIFSDDEVPTVMGSIVTDMESAQNLKVPKVGSGRTSLYLEAAEKTVQVIKDRPILGGTIGPFSLAGRLVGVSEAMIFCYEEPEMMRMVLSKAAEFLTAYIKEYKKTGVNGIVMAEPVTGMLSPDLAREFSEGYVRQIIEEVQDENFIVVYHNCGNATIHMIDSLLATGADAFHFGNAIDMAEMMPHIPENIIAMGNISPAEQFRNGTPESMKQVVSELLSKCGKYPNFIISSGCDIPPLSKWENIEAFFAGVNEYYGKA